LVEDCKSFSSVTISTLEFEDLKLLSSLLNIDCILNTKMDIENIIKNIKIYFFIFNSSLKKK
jgi:hypothetical protein